MEVDHDIDVVSHRQPQLFKHARELKDILPPHERLRIGNEDNLERGVPTRHYLMGKINQWLRIESLVNRLHISATKMGIHPDPVADRASEEPIDGKTEGLAEDVPAGLFQAADGAHPDHAHAEK